jgi:hypothetical protein
LRRKLSGPIAVDHLLLLSARAFRSNIGAMIAEQRFGGAEKIYRPG